MQRREVLVGGVRLIVRRSAEKYEACGKGRSIPSAQVLRAFGTRRHGKIVMGWILYGDSYRYLHM